MRILILALAFVALGYSLSAQQQGSSALNATKIYEKGNLKQSVILRNATGINSPSLDFSPVFYQNGLVYVSSRRKNGPIDKKIGETFFELFFAETDANGLPIGPRSFSLTVNSQVHEGPVAFSKDGQYIYLTRNNLEKGATKANGKGKVVMKIYEGRRGRYDWENIRELPFNSDNYTCVHPTLSLDGKRLFFSSNMPGGYGGMDIYMVERKGDTWTKPVNLGPSVNTTGNEIFPYLHESNYMFFSSNGHGGEGGLDIFLIDVSTPKYGPLKSLGQPFNSEKDDLGFIINEAGTRGYFSSDRPGGAGKDDIYLFEAGLSLLEAPLPTVKATIVAFNETNMEKLPGVDVRIFERAADGFIEGSDLYDVQLMPSPEGELMMRLIRKSEKELGAPQLITNRNGEAEGSIKLEKNYLLLFSKEGFESVEKLYSTAGEKGDIVIRVPMKPKSCATIAGKVNVQDYNMPAPNALIRIQNLTSKKEELVRANNNGEFEVCLPIGHPFTIVAEKEGYFNGTKDFTTVGANEKDAIAVSVNLKPKIENILKEPIKTGSVIVLENIYYDFDQYIIKQGAARDLDALAELMDLYKSMDVELIAYTDSRGTEKYNLDLSLKRAESARRYLIQKGIDEKRIKAFGYGESKIRNRCLEGVECTDEEHQYNRRTEVKVTRIEESLKIEYRENKQD